MNSIILKTSPKVRELTGSKKHTFILSPVETICPRGGWSGGSCASFRAVNFRTGQAVPLHVGNQWNVQSQEQPIASGVIVIETGTFCGKPATPRIHCNPADLDEVAKFLGVNSTLHS